MSQGDQSLRTAELYDPSTRTFSSTGNMASGRHQHTATLLNSGKVLIVGGQTDSNGSEIIDASTELYDPMSKQFTTSGSMATPRYSHAATLLKDGRVLIVGDGSGTPVPLPELYDPATEVFTATGSSMTTRRFAPTATLLGNGEVLIAGGGANVVFALSSAELYDPAIGSFTATGPMNSARVYQSSTLLNNGRVLIVGGEQTSSSDVLANAELY